MKKQKKEARKEMLSFFKTAASVVDVAAVVVVVVIAATLCLEPKDEERDRVSHVFLTERLGAQHCIQSQLVTR